MKKIAGVCVAALAVILLASGDSQQAHAQLPLVPHYKCYDVQTPPVPVPPVQLVTQFGVEQGVPVGPPTRMCLAATKNGETWVHKTLSASPLPDQRQFARSTS
jgi:hypothetical protein